LTFTATNLPGVLIVDLDLHNDERGFFARSWCSAEFLNAGLNPRLMQCNISFNRKRHTLRGMHFQAEPHEEAKVVRCTKGAIYDVVVDARQDSPTFRQWIAVELNDANRRMVYIPEGLAHGYQTLTDDTEVFYQMSEVFHPESARGVLWNDPVLQIEWPAAGNRIISERDLAFQPIRL